MLTIAGYTAIRKIGTGGFADVYLCRQENPSRMVAVKAIKSEMLQDKVLNLFVKEIKLLAQLGDHPHIMKVYDSGLSLNGRPYCAMEYCERVLSNVIKRQVLDTAQLLDVGISLCDAVKLSHDAGILHRDIKPSNLMYSSYGQLLLSDFGIARVLDDDYFSTAMSKHWSAPEVVSRKSEATKQSDIYSIGTTLYALCTGHNPFAEDDTRKLQSSIINGKYDKTITSGIPVSIRNIINKAMNKNIDIRYKAVSEILEDLQKVQVSLGLPPTKTYTDDLYGHPQIHGTSEYSFPDYSVGTNTQRDYKTSSSRLSTAHIQELEEQAEQVKKQKAIIVGLVVLLVIFTGALLF
ncbi:MAG: serine/threonine protein kinase [Candidatus Ancillula sp.]|jgi:serine/threonine protein kinase|nr:serine/threonine protein kinase [Candidatus Ancillula sp.]